MGGVTLQDHSRAGVGIEKAGGPLKSPKAKPEGPSPTDLERARRLRNVNEAIRIFEKYPPSATAQYVKSPDIKKLPAKSHADFTGALKDFTGSAPTPGEDMGAFVGVNLRTGKVEGAVIVIDTDKIRSAAQGIVGLAHAYRIVYNADQFSKPKSLAENQYWAYRDGIKDLEGMVKQLKGSKAPDERALGAAIEKLLPEERRDMAVWKKRAGVK